MKTYTRYEHLPKNARYIGSEEGGFMFEQLADDIEDAINPVCLCEDGTRHYFDLSN